MGMTCRLCSAPYCSCLPSTCAQIKFIMQIHHEQTHKKVWGTDTVTPTGSCVWVIIL